MSRGQSRSNVTHLLQRTELLTRANQSGMPRRQVLVTSCALGLLQQLLRRHPRKLGYFVLWQERAFVVISQPRRSTENLQNCLPEIANLDVQSRHVSVHLFTSRSIAVERESRALGFGVEVAPDDEVGFPLRPLQFDLDMAGVAAVLYEGVEL